MRKAMIVLFLSVSMFASSKPQAPATKAAKATGHAVAWTAKGTWSVLTWPFRPQKPKPAKKADGTGPIQTCRPGTNCDPVV